jgi:hypothetical protein
MDKSFRICVRLNPEYDQSLIEILKTYNDRNLSQIIRKILRDNLMSNTLSDTPKLNITKWNFPK